MPGGLKEAGHGVLGHLGITLDDATLAGPWQSGTRRGRHADGRAGRGYAGEVPGPPGTCFSSSEG